MSDTLKILKAIQKALEDGDDELANLLIELLHLKRGSKVEPPKQLEFSVPDIGMPVAVYGGPQFFKETRYGGPIW